MTKVPDNKGLNKTINLVALKDPVSGTVPAICFKIDKNEEKPPAMSQEYDDGSVLSPSVLATCRKNYPSGCTILECRLDASNRPVAHVLQVPGDSDAVSQKMSVLVEAKQTPTGPYSRVTSCPLKDTYETTVEGTKEATDHQQNSQESSNNYENAVKPREMIYRSPPNCEDTCPGAKEYQGSLEDSDQPCLFMERKNGLDPTDSELMLRGSLEKSMRKPNRVCPAKCCKPIEKPFTCPDPVGVSKNCTKDTLSISPSQDSLERYKDYISPNQLEKYRSCRSKRNGLQDECYLPMPRALLELEKAERERDNLGDDCRNLEKNESGVIRTKSEISRKNDRFVCA